MIQGEMWGLLQVEEEDGGLHPRRVRRAILQTALSVSYHQTQDS